MDRRGFLQLTVAGGAGLLLAGCGRVVAPILEQQKTRPVYEGIGTLPESFAATMDGDYDYAVFRLDDGDGHHPGFFTPWWQGITIPTLTAYIRQQFHGWPFAYEQKQLGLYLAKTMDHAATPDGEYGWRFVIHNSTSILTEAQWEAIVRQGNYGLPVDETAVPRHSVVDFRWGLPV